MSPHRAPKFCPAKANTRNRGFTLLEIMLVILIMGLVVSVVMFNTFGQSKLDVLEKQAKRFQVVFDMASDFAVLNQQQLGLFVDQEKQTYQFMYLDDEQKWRLMTDDKAFDSYQLPEEFTLSLQLEGLPWLQEDSLFEEGFDTKLSVNDDDIKIGDEEEKLPPPPQIYILSSGDITPFSMAFSYEPSFGSDQPLYFRVNGDDTPPLMREGPLDSLL
jgi:general secretion pathway protein H